jgi:hypothetical protein
MQPQHLYQNKEASALLWKVADASSPAVLRQTVMRSLVNDVSRGDSVQAFSRLWTLTGELSCFIACRKTYVDADRVTTHRGSLEAGGSVPSPTILHPRWLTFGGYRIEKARSRLDAMRVGPLY